MLIRFHLCYQIQLIIIMFKFFLCLILLVYKLQAQIISGEFYPANTTIGSTTNYSIKIVRDVNPLTFSFINPVQPTDIGSTIEIVFPSDFVSLTASNTISCSSSTNSATLTCTRTTGTNRIVISGYYINSSLLTQSIIQITLNNIINPDRATKTANFLYYIKKSDGSILDQSPSLNDQNFQTGVTLISGSFISCKISAGSQEVSKRVPFTFTLNPAHYIPSSGQVIIQIPLYWTDDINQNTTVSSTPTCTAISNVSSSISCTTTIQSSPVSLATITLSGLTSSTITSGFSFQISNILTPPYVSSTQNINIYSQWSDGIKIDQCSSVVSDVVSANFQSISFTSNNNFTVQSSFTGQLQLQISKAFSSSDTIQIIAPDQFINAVLSSSNFATFSVSNSGNNILMSSFPSVPSILPINSVIIFTLSQIKNAQSTRPLTIVVNFYRSNNLYLSSSTTYQATVGVPTSYSITSLSTLVRAVGRSTISIVTGANIYAPQNSILQITYPSTITASDLTSKSVQSAALNGVSINTGTYLVSNNKITISNIFNQNFTGSIDISLADFVNPPTIASTNFIMILKTSTGYSVFSSTYTMVADRQSLISNTVSSSSSTVLETSSTITLAITTNYGFSAISIIIPSEITVGSAFSSTCSPNSFTTCTLNGNNLTFIGNLQAGSYSLSWGKNTMPNSLAPTDTFTVYTYSGGNGVQISKGFLGLTMTVLAQALSASTVPSKYQNSVQINVTISYSLPAGVPTGTLSITFPSTLDITSASCTNCAVVPPTVNIQFTGSSIAVGGNILVQNVKNVASIQPTGSFLLTLTNSQSYKSVQSNINGWTNTITSKFTTIVSSGNAYKNETALFSFALSSLTGRQTFVNIIINPLFPNLTSAPTGGTLIGDHQVRFNIAGLSSTTVGLSLITPITSGNYPFILKTYSSDGFLIGESTSNDWTHSCSSTQCRSCKTSGSTTVCQSCYNKDISDYYIFDTSSQSCIQACIATYYLQSDNVTCSKCSTTCLQCANSSSTCTSCQSGKYLDKDYKTCVAQCRTTFYKNNFDQTCSSCVSPCLTCTDYAVCVTCIQNYFFLSGQCLPTCPVNKTVNNSVNRTCDSCDANCLTCQNFTYSCLSCNNTLNLYLSNQKCVSVCPTNTFVKNNVCSPCQLPCKVCFNSTTTCSTCYANETLSLYFNFTCISPSQCGIGHYNNTVNGSCDACPSQCSSCSSLTNCSVCISSYNLLGTSCITTCPNTTYPSSNVCNPCNVDTNGCVTCQQSANNCTSCQTNRFLYKGICYTTCPTTTFATKNVLNSMSICSQCNQNCTSCLNSTFCYGCVSGQFLYEGICYLNCLTFTYSNETSRTCIKCPTGCSTCTSDTYCQTCSTGYNLENDTACVITCTLGIANNQICYPCGLNCSLCQITTTTCKICQSGFKLWKNICYLTCPSNTLTLDEKTCSLCNQTFDNCTTCNNTQCLSCDYGQLTNGQCFPCQPGTYSYNNRCPTCPSLCTLCQSQTFCTACSSGLYLQSDFCVQTCPLNKIPNGTKCTACMQNCAVCDQSIATAFCLTCTATYYVSDGICVSSCPSPFVVNLNKTKCITEQQYALEYSSQSKIVPMPFTIGSVIVILIVLIIKCRISETHLFTLLGSFLAWMQTGVWILFIANQILFYMNYQRTALSSIICGIIGVIALAVLNLVHLCLYRKYILSDETFGRWLVRHACIHPIILITSTIFTFKFYRLIHSKLLSRQQFSMILSSAKKLIPFSIISVFSIFTCQIALIVGSSLALYNSLQIDQQFLIALDALVVTLIMILVLLLDLYHPPDYFLDDLEAKNIKNKMYFEQQSYKIGFSDQDSYKALDDNKNISRQELLREVQSGKKFNELSTGTKSKFKQGKRTINIDQDQLEHQPIQEESIQKEKNILQQSNEEYILDIDEGDMAVPIQSNYKRTNKKKSLNNIAKQESKIRSQEEISQQSEANQITKAIFEKWVPKQFDHHGYKIQYDENDNIKRFDQHGYEVKIDQNGQHLKFNEQGLQVKIDQQTGEHITYDKDGYIIKDGKKFDERGYQVQTDQNNNLIYFDKNGYQIKQTTVVNEDGTTQKNIQRYDKQGNKVQIDQNGNHHIYNQDGYQITRDEITDELRIINQDGKDMRKNQDGQWEAFDPNDDFILKKNQETGQYQKFDKYGYKIKKDQFGNVQRFDEEGYRIKLGWNDQPHRYDQEGYQIKKDQQGNIHRYDKDGYEMIIKDGRKRFYDENGYEVKRDFYGTPTLYDNDGNTVIIDPQTKKHRIFTPEGLQIIEENGQKYLKDKRGNKVIELEDGYYQKYDQNGNKIWLDGDGYEVETDKEGNINRYDKAGNLVEDQIQGQFLPNDSIGQENGLEQINLDDTKKRKLKNRFKMQKDYDFQGQYSKMVQQQDKGEQSQLFQDDNFREFHDIEPPSQRDLQKQYRTIVQNQIFKQQVDEDRLKLEELQDIQNSPYKNMPQKKIKQGSQQNQNQQATERDKQRVLQQQKADQEHQLKSVKDVSIDQRSFQNEGVQPISRHGSKQDDDQFQSVNEINPSAMKKKKKIRSNMSQLSYKQDDRGQTNTQYNYNTVNVKINNKKSNIIDFDDSESLEQENWEENQSPFVFQEKASSKANTGTNIVYIEDDDQNKDTLSDYIGNGFSRPRPSDDHQDLLSRQMRSIEEVEDELFDKLKKTEWQRRQFKLSGAPNPLVQYAKQIEMSKKKNLKQKMYLDESRYR